MTTTERGEDCCSCDDIQYSILKNTKLMFFNANVSKLLVDDHQPYIENRQNACLINLSSL